MSEAVFLNLRHIMTGRQNIHRGRHLIRSGMANVYKVRTDKGWRAVKVLRADTPQFEPTLLNEAMSLHAIGPHPNIVALHDVGRIKGRIYLELEYLAAYKFGEARLFPKGENEVLRIVRGIAGALAHVHAQGYVHRDVKPENFWLGNPVKLFDFGIAVKARHPIVKDGQVFGSPSYMPILSPEECYHLPFADIYGLGISTYEMLCGENPFDFAINFEKYDRMTYFKKLLDTYREFKKAIENFPCSPKLRVLLSIMTEDNPNRSFKNGAALVGLMDEYFPGLA